MLGIGDPGAGAHVSLAVPAPNPSSDRAAEFALALPAVDDVTLELYDTAGRRVASRPTEHMSAGAHRLAWNTGVHSPGLYFLRLTTASGARAHRSFVVVR